MSNFYSAVFRFSLLALAASPVLLRTAHSHAGPTSKAQTISCESAILMFSTDSKGTTAAFTPKSSESVAIQPSSLAEFNYRDAIIPVESISEVSELPAEGLNNIGIAKALHKGELVFLKRIQLDPSSNYSVQSLATEYAWAKLFERIERGPKVHGVILEQGSAILVFELITSPIYHGQKDLRTLSASQQTSALQGYRFLYEQGIKTGGDTFYFDEAGRVRFLDFGEFNFVR